MNHTYPTYTIQEIILENFNGIKNVTLENLPENASWIFLTGENGYGKTSILKGIASSLAGWESHTLGKFSENCCLRTKLHQEDHSYSIQNSPNINTFKDQKNKFHYLACYGSSRLDTYSVSSKIESENTVTKSLYDSQTYLMNIENNFRNWFYKEKHRDSQQKYKFVKTLLKDILNLKDIEIDYNTEKVYYIEKDDRGESYERMTLDGLASGYRSIIAMIGDMILRLFEAQPEVHNPSDLVGIVIIDEIDLHFHPKWQKKLPELLSKYFPKIQFIASTHSPIPLLGAPKHSVFLTVHRSVEKGVYVERLMDMEKDMHKLTPNLLLNSSIFGYADIFSKQFMKDQDINTSDTLEEYNFEKKIKNDLMKGLSEEKQNELRKLIK